MPLAIYNNKKGHDAEVLAKFQEPAWNNPVVRFFDADGKELVKREQKYETDVLLSRMDKALEAFKGRETRDKGRESSVESDSSQ